LRESTVGRNCFLSLQLAVIGLSLDQPCGSRYCLVTVSTDKFIADAMALPLAERVSLAQALWESIDALPDVDEGSAVAEAIQRDKDLSSGKVTGRTHEEVMRAAGRVV
jgi:putative addiction module component (TIGR02574 family)